MRPITTISAFLFLMVMFLSCKKGTSPVPPPPEKTLTLTANKMQCYSDGFDEVIFKVVNEKNVDVTSSATITLSNGTVITNSKTYISTPGAHTYKASIGNVQSSPISILANAPPPSPYRQFVYLDNIVSTNTGHESISTNAAFNSAAKPYCIIADFHVSDSMQTPEGSTLLTFYAIANGTYIHMNRNIQLQTWGFPRIEEDTLRRAAVGIALESTITGNTLNFKVKVGFSVNCVFPLNVACYLLEDSLIYNQASPLPGSNPWIVGVVHNNVFRKSLFNVLSGDPIPVSSQVNGTVWEKTYSFDLANYNHNRCEIVVFVQYGPNNNVRQGVLNVQRVKAGQNRGFQ